MIGNAPRTLPATRGPDYNNFDLSVFKNVQVSEKIKIELRGEAFNVFNMVNLGNPNTTFQPGTDGRNNNPNFGRITTAREARRLQLGVRLNF